MSEDVVKVKGSKQSRQASVASNGIREAGLGSSRSDAVAGGFSQ